MRVVHSIGATMAFGLGIVYAWMQVTLSFITLRQLSSMLVCWLRVVLSVIATVMILVREFMPVFYLLSLRRISIATYTHFG